MRLELTTPALLKRTVYKYRALTDCATGEGGIQGSKLRYTKLRWPWRPQPMVFGLRKRPTEGRGNQKTVFGEIDT